MVTNPFLFFVKPADYKILSTRGDMLEDNVSTGSYLGQEGSEQRGRLGEKCDIQHHTPIKKKKRSIVASRLHLIDETVFNK